MLPIRCLAGAIAAALIWSSAVFAATPLERLEISLWPDYDRPAVLVIMRGQLSPTTPLPTTVSLPMPVRAGSPHAVAKRAADGNLLTAEYVVVGDVDWAFIEITSDLPEIRLEYYIDFDASAPERRYVFSWPGGLGLDQVGFEVMQPPNATDFFISPESGFQQSVADGFTHHRRELGAKGTDDTFFVGVTYTKTDSQPTAGSVQNFLEALPATTVRTEPLAIPPKESEDVEPQGNSGLLLALVVILIAALVGSWGYFMGHRARSPQDNDPVK